MLALLMCMAGLSAAAQTGQSGEAFPYPQMPDTLRTVQGRAAYLMEHYWDGINFRDTTLAHRGGMTEQGFVNFIDLLPRIDSAVAEKGVAVFGRKAFGADTPESVRRYYADLAEQYLYSRESPVHNERTYIMMLQAMAASPATDKAERERLRFLISNIGKNSPGQAATDFIYTDRTGRQGTLYGTEAEYLVLYFYNPDCDDCHTIAKKLAGETMLTADPRVKVLAVYPDADRAEWEKHSSAFAKTWTDGCSPDGEIASRQLYYIRSTPAIYLLDSRKQVVLKDATPEELLQELGRRVR